MTLLSSSSDNVIQGFRCSFKPCCAWKRRSPLDTALCNSAMFCQRWSRVRLWPALENIVFFQGSQCDPWEGHSGWPQFGCWWCSVHLSSFWPVVQKNTVQTLFLCCGLVVLFFPPSLTHPPFCWRKEAVHEPARGRRQCPTARKMGHGGLRLRRGMPSSAFHHRAPPTFLACRWTCSLWPNQSGCSYAL